MGSKVVLLILVVVLLFSGCVGDKDRVQAPEAHGGILDLSNWDSVDGIVPINGEWEFYWKRLYLEEDFISGQAGEPDQLVVIPSEWNNLQLNQKLLPGRGFATYRLQVKVSEDTVGSIFTISSDDQLAAMMMEIDGEKVMELGVIGQCPETTVSIRKPTSATFLIPQETFSIIVQIANFSHHIGGMRHEIRLGPERNMSHWLARKRNREVLLLGVILTVFLYQIIIYFYHRRQKTALFFSLFCLLVFFRQGFTGEMMLLTLFNTIPFHIHTLIDHATYYLVMPLLFHFFYYFFSDRISFRTVKLFYAISSLFLIQLLVLPIPLSSRVIRFFDPFFLVGLLYVLGLIFYLVIHRVNYAFLILLGFLVMIVTAINDVLVARNVLYTGEIGPYGILVMILIQASVLAQNYTQAFKDKEQAYLEIQSLNQELFTSNQKLQELDLLKSNFISSVSHELRTPLTSMLGFASLIEKKISKVLSPSLDSFNQKERRAIQKIKENTCIIIEETKKLTEIINDVLSISKFDTGTVQWNLKEFSLEEVIEESAAKVKLLMEKKNLQYKQEIPFNLPHLYADKDQIKRVLVNLLSNAIKFTSSGHVGISVSWEEDQDQIQVKVYDTGPGIPLETQEVIFDRFKQVGSILTDKPQGTGLGLSICKEIILYHGGEIWVESEWGKGTIIFFTLPIKGSLLLKKRQEEMTPH